MPPHQSMASRSRLRGRGGDLAGFLPGAVVAPEVVVVERLEMRVHRDHARAGGVERDGLDGVAVDAGGFDGAAHGLGQRLHVVGVALGGVVGIFLLADAADTRRRPSPGGRGAIENRNPHAQGSEIDAGNDAHGTFGAGSRWSAPDWPRCGTCSSRDTAWRLRARPRPRGPGWPPRDARSRARRCSAAAPAACGMRTTPAPPKVSSGSSVNSPSPT